MNTLNRIATIVFLGMLASGCNGEGDASDGSSPDTDADTDTGTEDTDPDPTDTDTTDTAPTGDTGAPDCGGEDLLAAPPITEVDGLTAVPIDIGSIEATVVLDAGAQIASAVATVQFTTGAQDGAPIFDLRQDILSASLNGSPLDPQALAPHDFGGGAGAEMRVIDVVLPACSDHTLVLEYALEQPAAGGSRPLAWTGDTGVGWDFWMSDLTPGRYLEQWLPANLVYDRFALTLDLELVGSTLPHTLLTNGAVDPLADTHWVVTFPPTFTALSPLLVLAPSAELVAHPATTLTLDDGTELALELYKDAGVPADLSGLAADIEVWVEEFGRTVGPYPDGDRLTVYVWDEPSRSMEYDFGTTSNVASLKHELFHVWYGRGVKPARQSDGWIDEAWDMYSTESGISFEVVPFDFGRPPVTLSTDDPWSRVTPSASYSDGYLFFAGLADLMALGPLRDEMGVFYQENVTGLVTTQQLETQLYCVAQDPGVLEAFHRFVYGNGGAAPAPDPTVCD